MLWGCPENPNRQSQTYMIAGVEKMSKNLSKVAQALEDLYMVADIEDRPQSLLKEKPYDHMKL